MVDKKTQLNKKDAPPVSKKDVLPLEMIHAIAYLRWQREWYETFEVRRAKLLDILSSLHSQMSSVPGSDTVAMKSFLLGGQTVILEDIAEVRPDLVALLVIYNAGGRLGIGPWYITVDEALVSGEALIHNLLVAQADAARFGLKMTSVAYAPETSGHVSQLPQILRHFDVDAAFLRHGAAVVHLPFYWEAPDGSGILVVNHELIANWPLSHEDVSNIHQNFRSQRTVRPDGPFLWLFDSGNSEQTIVDIMPKVEKRTRVPAIQSDLNQYVRALRRELPDDTRPSLKGELRLQAQRENSYLLPGILSSRIYLKQINAHLQTYISNSIEPWLTVALTHGDVAYPENLRALLNHSWRLLLKNQGRNTLGGCCSDAVHKESEIRYHRIEDNCTQIVQGVLNALPGTPHFAESANQEDVTHLVIWNSHNWSIQQVVEIELQLPAGKYPYRLLTPDDDELLFGWKEEEDAGILSVLADVPAVGYTSYKLELADDPPAKLYIPVSAPGNVIGNVYGETLSVQNGSLSWKFKNTELNDLLQFYDGGDAGDIYNYSPPDPDVMVKADLIDNVEVETAPLYERLIIHHRMRVAPSLTTQRQRSRGLKLIELVTTATLYDHTPGVHLRTSFRNLAEDHRLRAHLRTGLNNDTVLVDSAFGLTKRTAIIEGEIVPPEGSRYMEGVCNTQPLQNIVAVEGKEHSIAILARGLPEYEALSEDNQLTLALTLVRAVGWLCRDDVRTRAGVVAPMIPVPEAQCQREIVAEYGIIAALADDKAALLRAGSEYSAPLQIYQYDEPPQLKTCSYLSVVSHQSTGEESNGNAAIMTSLKPPQEGNGWIVRLFNPHDKTTEVDLIAYKRPTEVHKVTMAEKVLKHIELDTNGRAHITFKPHEIITLRFMFESIDNKQQSKAKKPILFS